MFHKTSAICLPPYFSCHTKFPPILHFPHFFSPKLFSLIFFPFPFIRLPLLKLLKVKNPFFISHPTPFFFFFFSLTHFHFHHRRALSLTSPPPLATSLALATTTSLVLLGTKNIDFQMERMSSRGAAMVGFSVSFSLFLFWFIVIVLDWF